MPLHSSHTPDEFVTRHLSQGYCPACEHQEVQNKLRHIVDRCDQFQDWVLRQEPTHTVGRAGRPDHHPLAGWLKLMTGLPILMDGRFIYVRMQAEGMHYSVLPLPEWVMEMDRAIRGIIPIGQKVQAYHLRYWFDQRLERKTNATQCHGYPEDIPPVSGVAEEATG